MDRADLELTENTLLVATGGTRMGNLFPGAISVAMRCFAAPDDNLIEGKKYLAEDCTLRKCRRGIGGLYVPGNAYPVRGDGTHAVLARVLYVVYAE